MALFRIISLRNFPKAVRVKILVRVVFVACVLTATLALLWLRNRTILRGGWIAPAFRQPKSDASLEDVFVLFRTGATEALYKVPVHFNTTLSRLPHYVLFSDLEEDIAGHHLYNVLADIDEEIKRSSSDFALYNRLQAHGREAFSPEEIASWPSRENGRTGNTKNPGWKLDKWKFLPMVDKALQLHPDAKWYVFMEADTYISWPNLVRWLSFYDHSKPVMIGRRLIAGETFFGHGGSGLILSNLAMRKVSELHLKSLAEYDRYTATEGWAGDVILGKLLAEARIPIVNAGVNLLGERPSEINYAAIDSGRPLWCFHAVSFHHLRPVDIKDLWHMEEDFSSQGVLFPRFGDVFQNLILPQLRPDRDGWDNLSDGNVDAIKSYEDCRNACQSLPSCMQFSFSPGACRVADSIRLGEEVAEGSDPVVRSGWLMDRILSFAHEKDLECDKWSSAAG